jgi:hypothetical protein
MKIDKLIHAFGEASEEFDYFKEVTRRLEEVFGNSLTQPEGIALMSIISNRSFGFADGFVINDTAEINRMIGLADAGAIVASLSSDPDLDYAFLKTLYPAFDKESQSFREAYNDLLARLLGTPEIEEKWLTRT